MLAHNSQFESWFVYIKMLAHPYLFRSSLILLLVSGFHANIFCGTCCRLSWNCCAVPGISMSWVFPSIFMDGWVIDLLITGILPLQLYNTLTAAPNNKFYWVAILLQPSNNPFVCVRSCYHLTGHTYLTSQRIATSNTCKKD